MGLRGKEEKQMQIKCDGRLIFDLVAYCPNNVSKVSPLVHRCDLLEGQFGTVGSIIKWTFTLDGKKSTAKQIITAIDEEKKLIQLKVIEGEVMQGYKSFVVTIQCTNSVTLTVEFEKMNEGIPNPTSFMETLDKIFKDIDINHQAIPKLATN